jgi:hypothetical protein
MDIQIIDPTRYASWDDLLLSTPGCTFFHSSAWARVLSESYGYKPLYFAIMDNDKFRALVPIMEVKSFLTGKRGVSLPFTDYCDPIIEEEKEFVDLFDTIIEQGRRRGWKYLGLRGGEKYLRSQESVVRSEESESSDVFPVSCLLSPGSSFKKADLLPRISQPAARNLFLPTHNSQLGTWNIFPYITYLGHTLFLGKGEQSLYKGLRDSTKRNIKKAKAEGVDVRISDQPESIDQFYNLNSVTRKRHGLPPQPFSFFKNVFELVIKKGYGIVVIGLFEGNAIAASVFFHFGKKANYKYGASDLQYQNLRTNNLVMWEAIRYYCGKGFDSLSMGRTEPENQGLIQFKSGWGATEHQINYYRYDLKKESFVSGSLKVTGFHNKIFRNIPIPLLNRLGNILYRHVG